jgi:hypothetical protein
MPLSCIVGMQKSPLPFMVPMHICEVVLRNAIVGAIQEVYGPTWYAPGTAFERSLPRQKLGYSPFRDLGISRKDQPSAGKVIPELKFMFWVSMVTARRETRLWTPYLAKYFPSLPLAGPDGGRRLLYYRLEEIRKLRNRIAHHEPIFDRALGQDYSKIVDVISWTSAETTNWLRSFEKVTIALSQRP